MIYWNELERSKVLEEKSIDELVCFRCEKLIQEGAGITLVKDKFYHTTCYRCYNCGEAGDKMLGEKAICQKCIDQKIELEKKIDRVAPENTQALIRKDTLDEYGE